MVWEGRDDGRKAVSLKKNVLLDTCIYTHITYAIYNECMIKTHIFYPTARGIVCWVIEVKLNRYENSDEWLRLVKVGLWFQLNWKALWFSELYAHKYMSSQVNFMWMQPSFVCISPKHSLLVNLIVLSLFVVQLFGQHSWVKEVDWMHVRGSSGQSHHVQHRGSQSVLQHLHGRKP